MSGSKSSAQGNDFHQFESGLIILGLFLLVLLGIWYGRRVFIVDPIFAIDWLNYKITFGLANILGTFIHHLTTIRPGAHRDFLYIEGVLTGKTSAQTVTLHDLGVVQLNVGESCGLGAAIFTGFLALWAGFFNSKSAPKRRFMMRGWRFLPTTRINGIRIPENALGKLLIWIMSTKLFSLLGFKVSKATERRKVGEDFIAYQARQWRHVVTSVKFDSERRDPRWRMAETPLEWCYRHGIRHVDEANFDVNARKGLLKQLGKEYESVTEFPVYAKAILALAWLNRTQGMKSYKLAGDLAEIIDPHGEVFPSEKVAALINPILDKNKKDKYLKVDPITFFDGFLKRYTGMNTALIAIMGACGPFSSMDGGYTGPLPPNSYLWLISVNRTTWYALQNVGAGNFRVEGIGAIHQFNRERLAGKKLPPDMDGPIRGLREYFMLHGITDLELFKNKILQEQL